MTPKGRQALVAQWIEQQFPELKVGSSNLSKGARFIRTPSGCGSAGRVLRSGRRGRGFESRHPDTKGDYGTFRNRLFLCAPGRARSLEGESSLIQEVSCMGKRGWCCINP